MKLQLNTDIDSAGQLAVHVNAVETLNAQDILNLMQSLPAIQLAIFNLYEIDGYNHDEIGGMLNIPPSSSRVYLSRAKEKLRKIINEETQNHG